MIIDAIIGMVVGLFTGILGLFPAFTLDLGETGSALGSTLAGANSVFPVVTLGWCIGAVIGLRVFLFVVSTVIAIWDKFPFKFS